MLHFPLRQHFSYGCFLLIFSLFIALTGGNSSVYAVTNANTSTQDRPENKRYQEAKFYYNELQNSTAGKTSRQQWLRGAHNFRTIYLAHPKSDLAAPCLFMLARISHDMYTLFLQEEDLEESITYYKDITRLFSSNNLADDAYYALAEIALQKQRSPRKAADYLIRILERYPQGDMFPKAEKRLKYLSKEYNIPLPKIMMAPFSQGGKLSYILPLKYWSSEDYTRILIIASNPVNYRETLLPKTPNAPERLFIDFKDSYIEPKYRAPIPIRNGLLKQVRTGQHSEDTVRVVLDIESISNYRIFNLPDPFRVVIDVRGKKGVESPPATVDHQQPAPQKTENIPLIRRNATKHKLIVSDSTLVATPIILPDAKKLNKDEEIVPKIAAGKNISLAQQLGLRVKRIVLDPGHGGKDPGAMAYGMKEKDVVLQLGKYLAPLLRQQLGCEVFLTRDTDTFIPLEERTAIANTKGADLFVSLHVNAHPSKSIRGMETYYLNLSSNAEAMRVAAMENATSTHQMSDLQNILADIMKNAKKEESAKLAAKVQKAIVKTGAGKYPGIKDLGVKQAPFYVLIGAEMPAILVEAAFITNKKDADNLQNKEFLQEVAAQITAGIESYIQEL